MVDVLDVADLVEAEVEGSEVREVVEAADAGDEVVVEVEVREGRGEAVEALDGLDGVLAEAEAGDMLEAVEAEGGDGGDAGLSDYYLVRVEGFTIEKVCGEGLSVRSTRPETPDGLRAVSEGGGSKQTLIGRDLFALEHVFLVRVLGVRQGVRVRQGRAVQAQLAVPPLVILQPLASLGIMIMVLHLLGFLELDVRNGLLALGALDVRGGVLGFREPHVVRAGFCWLLRRGSHRGRGV